MISQGAVPYEQRQVWAAINEVAVETCLECPFFRAYPNGPNMYNQPGECCWCRAEGEFYKMSGAPLCIPELIEFESRKKRGTGQS